MMYLDGEEGAPERLCDRHCDQQQYHCISSRSMHKLQIIDYGLSFVANELAACSRMVSHGFCLKAGWAATAGSLLASVALQNQPTGPCTSSPRPTWLRRKNECALTSPFSASSPSMSCPSRAPTSSPPSPSAFPLPSLLCSSPWQFPLRPLQAIAREQQRYHVTVPLRAPVLLYVSPFGRESESRGAPGGESPSLHLPSDQHPIIARP